MVTWLKINKLCVGDFAGSIQLLFIDFVTGKRKRYSNQ